jgi:hypothetical protein
VHFKPFHIDGTEIQGEMTVDDLVIFSTAGALSRVERMWTAVKKYSLMVDQAHSQAIEVLKKDLETISPKAAISEEALSDAVLAEMELEALSDSDSYLVKSLIFLNLLSFVEHARKEIYKLIHPKGPNIPARGSVGFIIVSRKEHAARVKV